MSSDEPPSEKIKYTQKNLKHKKSYSFILYPSPILFFNFPKIGEYDLRDEVNRIYIADNDCSGECKKCSLRAVCK
ncbi:MAG: hypothetical protein QXX38_00560 [Candidatus Aenigmatarchaeota archaeon]